MIIDPQELEIENTMDSGKPVSHLDLYLEIDTRGESSTTL